MQTEAFEAQLLQYRGDAEQAVNTYVQRYLSPLASRVGEAARYSLLSPGKRVRGSLVLAACDLFHGDREAANALAAAVEMVHAYSLIHDDLPCMDDDDLRRGMPACHIQYGEATSLLAGDALLTEAFHVISEAPLQPPFALAAVKTLAAAAGLAGMVGGQEMDLHFETHVPTPEQLTLLHQNKTGALITAALQLGCLTAQIEAPKALHQYGEEIGLVFQIVDDVLDATGNTEELGKRAGIDAENQKTTFVTLFGVEGAKALALQHTEKAKAALAQLEKTNTAFLSALADSLLKRRK